MEVEGKVLHEIRVDDSRLEADLKSVQKKVEQSAKKTADKSESIEAKSAEAKKDVKKDVTDYYEHQNEQQVKSDDSAGQKSVETAKKHGSTIKGVFADTAKAIGSAMLKTGTAVKDVSMRAVNSAVSMDKAMNQFILSTGKGKEETERYQNVLEDIYKNNYGESFDDIGYAMAEVTKSLGDMSDAELKNVTESAFALKDVFGCDIAESAKAAQAMVENFGISGDKAMGLIAAGAKNGLNDSGKLMDGISEYSAQFAKVGLDADDMFKIFEKGAETGAWNLDKIGDAVNEMAIRVVDGSDATKEGFEGIGLNADELAAKFAAGGDSAKEAFMQTVDALASMEDPLAQNAAGVALFGSAWEDLGPEVVAQLADIEGAAYGTGEELNAIKDITSDDLGSTFEGLKRSVELLLQPLGEELIPILSDTMDAFLPIIEEALPPLVEEIGQFIEQLQPAIEQFLPLLVDLFMELLSPLMDLTSELFPILVDLFMELLPPLMDLAEKLLPILVDLFEELIPPIVKIIDAVLPILLELVDALLPIFQILIDLLEPVIDLFMELLEPILELISDALVPLVDALMPIVELITDLLIPILEVLMSVFSEIFSGIVKTISDKIETITDVINSVVEFIKNVFTGNWEEAWENVAEIFSSIIEGIGSFFKTPINWVIDGINGFIKGINKIKIPDWVPLVGGKGFNIPTIPRLRVGMDYVPNDDFPALLHKGEAVLTAQENALYRSVGGFEGMMRALSRSTGTGEMYVTVNSPGEPQLQIDYVRLGNQVAHAIEQAGLAIKVDKKELGRIVREVQN